LRVEYIAENRPRVAEASLRSGRAGTAWVGADGRLESATRFKLSPNTAHALVGHGVVEALNELPLQGRLGSGLEVVIPSPILDDARAIFYAADTKTYGAVYEFVVDRQSGVEYRIRIDNREYQRSLSRLQYLVSTASREGRLVWLQI
jgi:hypothetical protein